MRIKIEELKQAYSTKKTEIKKRLRDFRKVWQEDDHRIFSELVFCLCTPQSKARECGKAVSRLVKSNVLFEGDVEKIISGLRGVRFPNNKARYIAEARDKFTENGRICIKDKINSGDVYSSREWFYSNVKGLGLKESSHFLRNIGFGKDLAIIDVHILKNMVRYGLIEGIPKTISKGKYFLFETILKDFSRKTDIPIAELDLLFWSAETGEIFK